MPELYTQAGFSFELFSFLSLGRTILHLITGHEYLKSHLTTEGWLLQNLIPRPGMILLCGPPKSGKSTLALALGDAIAQGKEFLGKATQQATVLYLQLDTKSPPVWKNLLRRGEAHGLSYPDGLLFLHPDAVPTALDVCTPAGLAWLSSAIQQAAAELVVLDVLREVHMGDENESHSMKAVGDALGRACQGRSLLLLHHARKPFLGGDRTPDPILDSRGSSYLTGKMDAVWLLQGNALRITSRFDEDRTWSLRRDPQGFWTSPDVQAQAVLVEQLLDLCRECPEVPHDELWKIALHRWGIARATFVRLLSGQSCTHRLDKE